MSHCDRSPVQSAWNTRVGSPDGTGAFLRPHDVAQAGETVRVLRERMHGCKFASSSPLLSMDNKEWMPEIKSVTD